MKLVIAVIQDYDTDSFLKAVSAHGIGATRIASAGGFLRMGNTTVFMAVDNRQVSFVKQLLKMHCRVRELEIDRLIGAWDEVEITNMCSTRLGGGVAFVARISHFEQIPRRAATAKATE